MIRKQKKIMKQIITVDQISHNYKIFLAFGQIKLYTKQFFMDTEITSFGQLKHLFKIMTEDYIRLAQIAYTNHTVIYN